MFGWYNAQSLLGLALTLGLCWLLSENRERFPWMLAFGAVSIQVALVLLLFGFPPARGVLLGVSGAVDGLAASAQAGAERKNSETIEVTKASCNFMTGSFSVPLRRIIAEVDRKSFGLSECRHPLATLSPIQNASSMPSKAGSTPGGSSAFRAA